MELRVVSLPPMISSSRFPRYSSGVMCRVTSLWAIIEIRSPRGSSLIRWFQSSVK